MKDMFFASGITWPEILEKKTTGNLNSQEVTQRVLSALNMLVSNKEVRNLTQLALRVQVPYQKISDIKHGKSSFNYDLLLKINDAFPNAFNPNNSDAVKSERFLQVIDGLAARVRKSVQPAMFPKADLSCRGFLMDVQMILDSRVTPFKKMSDIAKELNVEPKILIDACSGRTKLPNNVRMDIAKLLSINEEISALTIIKPSVSNRFNDIVLEDSETYTHRYKYPKKKQTYIGYRIAEIIIRYHKVIENYEVMAQNIGIEPNRLRLIILGYIPITDSILRSILLVYPQIDPIWLSIGKGQVLLSDNLQEVNKVVFENHRLALGAWNHEKNEEKLLEQLKMISVKLDNITITSSPR